MQKLYSLLVLLLLSPLVIPVFAQETIRAQVILEKLQNNQPVSYENVTIQGDLDFTFYFEKKYDDRYSKKRSKWSGDDNSVEETIKGKIAFVNCTFSDDVLAYIHDDDTDFTFTASFDENVVFKNCTFEEKSAFKYSNFERAADFSGSRFDEEALFKYAEFEEYVDFSGSRFDEDANFKYTKFRNGLDFSNTSFRQDLNLKYAKINGEFKSEKMDIQDELDVKYTEINGQSFSKYLLRSR